MILSLTPPLLGSKNAILPLWETAGIEETGLFELMTTEPFPARFSTSPSSTRREKALRTVVRQHDILRLFPAQMGVNLQIDTGRM